jgi:ribosomal protein L11 methyltransferase
VSFLELSFTLEGLDADAAEEACVGLGALSVSFSDEGDDAIYEPRAGEIRLWPATRMQALYAAARTDPALISALARELGVAPQRLRARAVADRAWEREWLRDFHARRFGRRLWICPRHESVETAEAVVVRLDPGLAFGTGTHASTALCLQWLDGAALAGSELIDYGCGSGVLAIAALKLGARRAYCFDIDPQALLATRENAEGNGVADRLQVFERDQDLPGDGNLLLANILSEVLNGLAARFAALLAPGGQILLCGILAAEATAVTAQYSAWFDMQTYRESGDWTALCGTRRGPTRRQDSL